MNKTLVIGALAALGAMAIPAAADAQSAPFRTLHENDADKGGGDERLDDEEEGEHVGWMPG